MSDTKSIIDFWPMANSQPRESQVTVLKWGEALPPHIKYLLCEVPVGGGKSPIALTLSAWLSGNKGSSCILTPQKILQKQYEDSFDASLVGSMYGKANYTCTPKRTNCDIGGLIKPRCGDCPHKQNFAKARIKPNIVLNYTLALLYSISGMEFIRQKQLMVFDECHTLENNLTEFLALTVSEYLCKRYGSKWKKPNSLLEARAFLVDYYLPAMSRKLEDMGREVVVLEAREDDGYTLTTDEAKFIKEYDELVETEARFDRLLAMSTEELAQRYVFIPDKTFFRFKELYGANIFKTLLEPLADKFLFMSSTILDKDEFCRDLGLDPKKAAFISVDSEFPVENRPVIFMPTMKMTYGWDGPERKGERKEMIDKIVELCESHSDDSGVIHTGSFQVAKWLVENLTGKIPQRVLHHNPEGDFTRDEVIAEYLKVDGTKKLLISPSVTEGLDLKDDLARFNIIAKTPYPFLGDAWVKARQEKSSSWYSRQAMIGVIQGCGRVVRGKTDWGYTYILDSSFISLYTRIKDKIPKWWHDGFEEM